MEDIFDLRQKVARIGSNDWMGWWDSNALTLSGEYALKRLFRRSSRLTAAHLAIRSARIRHDHAVPQERLIHLFNFGEAFEGAFGRWLIDRKAEGWTPGDLVGEPEDPQKVSVAEALKSLDCDAPNESVEAPSQNGCLVLGRVSPTEVEEEGRRLELAKTLVGAYGAGSAGKLVVPYFRLERH